MPQITEQTIKVLKLDNGTTVNLDSRYRYRLVGNSGDEILLRDDGESIHFLFLRPAENCPQIKRLEGSRIGGTCKTIHGQNGCFTCETWVLWAKYMPNDLHLSAELIADTLMICDEK